MLAVLLCIDMTALLFSLAAPSTLGFVPSNLFQSADKRPLSVIAPGWAKCAFWRGVTPGFL